MASFIRNAKQVQGTLAVYMKRIAETMPSDVYREFVRQVFDRILMKTPQYSGAAVANWNLSLGAPDMSFNPLWGDHEISGPYGPGDFIKNRPSHKKGDLAWIRFAQFRAKPVLAQINYRSRVFITNNIMGDEKFGKGYVAYLQQFQNAGDGWQDKLRAVNKPYEVVADSVRIVGERFIAANWGVPRVGFGLD